MGHTMLSQKAADYKDKNGSRPDVFQHRHYATVAAVIARLKDRDYVALAFAKEFEDGNPRFDRGRFLRACGIVV